MVTSTNAVFIGATATMLGTGITEVLSKKQSEMHEALIVSMIGGILTAISIYVADKVTNTKPNASKTWKATLLGMVASSLATFITGYTSEKAGINPYIRGLIVGISGGLTYIAIRHYS